MTTKDKDSSMERKREAVKQAQALERKARTLMPGAMVTKVQRDKRKGPPKPWRSGEDE